MEERKVEKFVLVNDLRRLTLRLFNYYTADPRASVISRTFAPVSRRLFTTNNTDAFLTNQQLICSNSECKQVQTTELRAVFAK